MGTDGANFNSTSKKEWENTMNPSGPTASVAVREAHRLRLGGWATGGSEGARNASRSESRQEGPGQAL